MVPERVRGGRTGRGRRDGRTAHVQHRRSHVQRRRFAPERHPQLPGRRGQRRAADVVGRHRDQVLHAAAPRPAAVDRRHLARAEADAHRRGRQPGLQRGPHPRRADRLGTSAHLHPALRGRRQVLRAHQDRLFDHLRGRRPLRLERGVLLAGDRELGGSQAAALAAVADADSAHEAASAAARDRLQLPAARPGSPGHRGRGRLGRHRRPWAAPRGRLALGDLDGGGGDGRRGSARSRDPAGRGVPRAGARTRDRRGRQTRRPRGAEPEPAGRHPGHRRHPPGGEGRPDLRRGHARRGLARRAALRRLSLAPGGDVPQRRPADPPNGGIVERVSRDRLGAARRGHRARHVPRHLEWRTAEGPSERRPPAGIAPVLPVGARSEAKRTFPRAQTRPRTPPRRTCPTTGPSGPS